MWGLERVVAGCNDAQLAANPTVGVAAFAMQPGASLGRGRP